MTTEIIISIAALAFLAGSIAWLIHIGQRDAELIFEADYYHLSEFIRDCQMTDENEDKIRHRLNELSEMQGADKEKLQVLNTEFRRKFIEPKLDELVCHEYYEQ